MRFPVPRRLLLLFLVLTGVSGMTGLAVAACPPPRPLPPCDTPGFTGRPGTSAPRCGDNKSSSTCRHTKGPRGPRGVPGKEGPAGPRGSIGADGARGQAGARGESGVAGPAGATGPQGTTGADGLQGLQGVQGETGPEGPQGLSGVQGETGAAGPPGATGPEGATGSTGADGQDGVQGEVGPAGPEGPEGAEGPPGVDGVTGETGPEGSNGLSQYAYFYNLGAQSVAIEEDVNFDSDGVKTAGITHGVGSDEIVILEAGIYMVSFSVSGTEPNQMAIYLNGVLVPGTVYGSGAGTQQNSGQAVFAIPAEGVITIRNHTSAAAVTLAPLIGGTQPTSNASVVIEKLA